MKSHLLFTVREIRVLSVRAKIVIFDDDISAIVAEIDYDGTNLLVDVEVIFFYPENIFINFCCLLLFHFFFSFIEWFLAFLQFVLR